jgi:hypothetical protein
MSDGTPDRDLAGLEAALKGLGPAPARLARDRLLFRAGQLSARPTGCWVWPAATAALALVATGLATALLLRPAPGPVAPVIIHAPPRQLPRPTDRPPVPAEHTPEPEPRPGPPEAVAMGSEPPPDGYLRLRDQVLRWGVEALPGPAPTAAAPPSPLTTRDLPELAPERPAPPAPRPWWLPEHLFPSPRGPL